MVVGYGIAISRDEEARSLACNDFLAVGRIRHAEPLEESLERRPRREWQLLIAGVLIRRPLHFHPHGDDGRLHLLDNVGKTDRTLRKLLDLVGQILGVSDYFEYTRLGGKSGRDKNRRRRKAGNGGRQQRNTPCRQYSV